MQSDPLAGQMAAADEPHVVELVNRAVSRRDPAAFGQLYEIYFSRIYRYLYLRSGSQAEAEDLTEQVFLKAWQSIDRFEWRGRPFATWLFRLAHNVLVDHLRRRRPVTSLTPEEGSVDVASEAATLDFTRSLDGLVLASAIAELNSDQQQVIVLKFVEGLSNSEAAAVMDRGEGAVRSLQLRALLSLRRVLERQDEAEAR